MSLILAILLGLILFSKVAADNAEIKRVRDKYRTDFEKSIADADAFRAKYEDLSAEMEIKNSLSTRTYIKSMICDNTAIVEPSPNMVMMVALGLRGKIPHDLFENKICGPYAGDQIEMKDQWIALCEFLAWYNKLLKDHGVSEDLMMYKRKAVSSLTNCSCEPLSHEYQDDVQYITWSPVNQDPRCHSAIRIIMHPYCIGIKDR